MMFEAALLRQILYRLFAWLFLAPDETSFQTLQKGAEELFQMEILWAKLPFADSLRSLLSQLKKLNGTAVTQLSQEHNRLFLINPLVPPYESIFLASEPQARGWIAAHLERTYERYGLAISALNELPDHLAVELEFMSYLCEQEALAWQADDAEAQARFAEAQRAFIEQHLSHWLPDLHERVRAFEPNGLYAQVTEALNAFMLGTR